MPQPDLFDQLAGNSPSAGDDFDKLAAKSVLLGASERTGSKMVAAPNYTVPALASDEALGPEIGLVGSAWNALNSPIADFGGHPGRTQDLVTRALTMGQSTAQAEKTIAGIPSGKGLFTTPPGPKETAVRTFLESSLAGKDASIAKTGAEMFTTPLGLLTFGAGGTLAKLGAREAQSLEQLGKSLDTMYELRRAGASADVLQQSLNEVQAARDSAQTAATLSRSARAVEGSAGAGFGGQGALQAKEGYSRLKDDQTPQERALALSEMASGAGQALLGGVAVGHAGTGEAPDISEHLTRADRAIVDTQAYLKNANASRIPEQPSGVPDQLATIPGQAIESESARAQIAVPDLADLNRGVQDTQAVPDLADLNRGRADIQARLRAGNDTQLPDIKDLPQLGEAISRNPLPQAPDSFDQLSENTPAPKPGVFDKLTGSATAKTGAAFDSVKQTGQAILDSYMRPPEWTDFDEARGKWDGAIQKAAFDGRAFAKTITEELPDKARREAITNFVQAGGDEALLRQRAAASAPEYAKGYEIAANLTPQEKAASASISAYFDSKLAQAIDSGMLKTGLENYVNQVWVKPNSVGTKLLADVDYSKLKTNPEFIRKRILGSYFEGEQLGFKPRNKDIGALVTAYDQSFARAAASRGFVKQMLEGTGKDGRPLLVANADRAVTIPATEGKGATLISPKFIGDAYSDYRPIAHSALRDWRWIGKDEAGNPIFQKGDLWVHPDVAGKLKNILGKSAVRNYTLTIGDKEFRPGAAVMNFSQKIKGSMLSYSLFHQVQLGVHAFAHWVSPFQTKGTINLDNPTQMALVEHGLQIADYHAQEAFMDGHDQAYAYRIPVIGRVAQKYSDWLFHDYVPNLKMKTAQHILERNTARYSSKLSRDQILSISADQANAAFGELNYSKLARNKGIQDGLRLLALAPDFTEARARFLGQALKPYGREQAIALVRGAAMIYVTARVANALMNDGDTHPEEPFGVKYASKTYRLRSMAGDIEHLVTDPRNFFTVRENPTTLKPILQLLSKRDEYGRPRPASKVITDTLKGWTPIAIQKAIKDPKDFSLVDSILQSVGVSSVKDRKPPKGKGKQ